MSYRRKILTKLRQVLHQKGEGASIPLHPIDILGKAAKDRTRYWAAVEKLLEQEYLLRGTSDDNPHVPLFCLNPVKIEEIDKELSWLRDPTIQFVVGSIIALAGLGWAVIEFLLKK